VAASRLVQAQDAGATAQGFVAGSARNKVSFALLATALAALVLVVLPLAFAARADAAPNILFIVTDDQELEGTMAWMPKTTKWFKDGDAAAGITGGTEFTQGTVTTPVCCPSRSSIMTGKYAHNHGVRKNPDAPNLDHQTTMQRYLQQAGYRTGLFGKLLNEWNLAVNPPFWNDWSVLGTQEYSGVEVNEQGTRKFVYKYSTNYVADKAVEFLQSADSTNDAQPWFLYVAPTSPHSPYQPEPKYQDIPAPALQEDAAYFEADRTDKPYWVQTQKQDSDDIKLFWPEHFRMLKTADDLVDRVMQTLRTLNEDQNTLAFFISDNGFMWGEHGLRTKAVPYQEAIRVPIYLRWPGWPGHAGTRTDNRLVANIDLAPTALAAAGITPPTPMDGRSVLDTNWSRGRILSEGAGAGVAPGNPACPGVLPTWAAIRTTRFHYIEYYKTVPVGSNTCDVSEYTTDYNTITDREYYDITPNADPMELTNLFHDGNPANDPPTAGLSALLADDRTCSGNACIQGASNPDTLITERPSNVSGSTSATFSFTSSVPGSKFECRLDDFFGSQPFVSCQSHQTWTGLSNGSHKLEVRAVTGGGQRDSTPYSYTWSVDTSFPETTLASGPSELSNNRQATFLFSSSDPNAGFQCRLDSTQEADFQTCSSPRIYNNLADGTHIFDVRAVRVPAQIDPTPASTTWTIDATAPDTQLTPSSGFSIHRTVATFNITTTASQSSNVAEAPARLECKLDGASYSPCRPTRTVSGLTKGAHTLSVRSTDLAGNTDPSPATFSWNIDTVQSFRNTPNAWPQVTAGTEVKAIFPDTTGGFYIGGDFTEIGFPGGQTWQRTDLAHINADGTVDEAWKPSTENGKVNTITGAFGVIYIGGTFTGMKGSNDAGFTQRNRLGAVAWNTGSLTSWNPNATNAVNALTGGRKTSTGSGITTLYAAGAFQNIGGVTRRKIAEIKLSDGTLTSWNPDANFGATLNSLAITERSIYVGGTGLTQIGGKARNNLAEIDRFTGQATDWDPNPNGSINTLALRPEFAELPTLLVGGGFTSIGQPQVGRQRTAEINLVDNGSATAWDPSPSGSIYALQSFDCTSRCSVILGGPYTSLKSAGPTPVPRARLAETDGNAGEVQDWNPSLDHAVNTLACTFYKAVVCDSPSGTLAVGGLFTTTGGIGGVPLMQRNLLAFYSGCPATSAC
jgi:arylsulfatase A-like enzyme